jgi:hypothetical protein
MTEPRIQLLDDLATEFARVAERHERKRHERRFPRMVGSPARTVAIVASALLLAVGGAYAVPPTRAAIDDLTASFAGWVAGDDEQAPGTPLAPGNDAPDWVREQGGRLIAEQNGVELYVTRVDTAERGTLLNFTMGDGVAIGGTIDDWRERFDDQAVVVLGAANFGSLRDMLDERGRFPLLGVTARSVPRRAALRTGTATQGDGRRRGLCHPGRRDAAADRAGRFRRRGARTGPSGCQPHRSQLPLSARTGLHHTLGESIARWPRAARRCASGWRSWRAGDTEAIEQALEPVGELGVTGTFGQAIRKCAGGREPVGGQALVNLPQIDALLEVPFAGGPAGFERDEPRRVSKERHICADRVSVAEPSSLQER